jgi:hypothetical protein
MTQDIFRRCAFGIAVMKVLAPKQEWFSCRQLSGSTLCEAVTEVVQEEGIFNVK